MKFNMLWPQRGSATRRKNLRRDIRRTLGTSSEPAPELQRVLNSARTLGSLLDLTSGGRFGVSIYDFETGASMPVGDAITLLIEAERDEREKVDRIRATLGGEARDGNRER